MMNLPGFPIFAFNKGITISETIDNVPQSSRGFLRKPSSLRWKLVMGRWVKPPQSRKRGLMTCLASIYQQSWLTGEIPDAWNLANITSIYKDVWKDDPGKYRPYHGSRQGYRRDHPECHYTAHAEQPGHQVQPKWKAGPAWPILLLWQTDPFL